MLDMLAMASWPLWMFVDLLSHIVKMVLDQGNPRHGLLFENRQCVRHRVTHMSALPFYIYIYPFRHSKHNPKGFMLTCSLALDYGATFWVPRVSI